MTRLSVNNDFYDDLGDRWYTDDGHAIALLRAEAAPKVEYVGDVFRAHGVEPGAKVLDVACGAGLVGIPLAQAGFDVTGVDAAADAVAMARLAASDARVEADPAAEPGAARFRVGDAYALDAADATYDAVLLMDFLEHVERPGDIVAEAARVLRPGGVLVFHTFNRTWLAALFAIQGLTWAVRESPPNLHVYRLFVTPDEVRAMLDAARVQPVAMQGLRPDVASAAFWWTLWHRRVHPDFGFVRTSSLQVGYMGAGVKRRG